MEQRLVYRDSNGVRRTAIVDDAAPEILRVNTEVNLDEILAGIQRDRELEVKGSANKTVARVPMTIVEQSIHEQWDEDRWKQWLNDPANEPFRIWKGRV